MLMLKSSVKQIRLKILLSCVVLLAQTCASATKAVSTLTKEESAIVAALLSMYVQNPCWNVLLVVETPTFVFPRDGSRTSASIPRICLPPSGAVLVSRATIVRILKSPNNWNRFWARYPRGKIVRISFPEIGADGEASLVSYVFAGTEGGGAEQVRFRKIDGVWRVTSRRALWVN